MFGGGQRELAGPSERAAGRVEEVRTLFCDSLVEASGNGNRRCIMRQGLCCGHWNSNSLNKNLFCR